MSAGSTGELLESALRGSEVGLRQVIDAMPHMTWVASAEKGCEFLSRHWEEFTGVSAAELMGYGWTSVIHPDDLALVMEDWRGAIDSGREFQHRCRMRRKDGEYHWFDNRGVQLRNNEGGVVKWFGTTSDVHEIYAARDALAKNDERLRYVELATQDCVYDWDIVNRITRRNDAFRTQFGAPATHVSGDWWSVRIHPDDRDRVLASADAALRARQTLWQIEYRLRRVDGSYATVIDRGYILYDAAGKPVRMIGALADMSARKKVEQSLRDAQGRLLSALEGGGMATWIWDIPSDALEWDDAAYRLWGRTKEELAPLTLRRTLDFIHPDDRARIVEAVEEFFRTGVDTIVEFRTARRDGALQWLQVRGRIERDESGKPIRMAGAYIDITNRKRTEEAQLRTQKMEALGTLAGGIAHDFNNILLAIAGNVRLALDDARAIVPNDHTLRRSLEEIEKASARAADLVRRILTFSRQQEPRRETMQLRPVILDAVKLLRPTLPVAIEIRTSFADDAPAVSTDAIQIHQVVMNLVTNAAHAIGDRAGVIDISLRPLVVDARNAGEHEELGAGLYACLSVADSGSGMDPQILDRIFDPFFTTKQAGQGTGLGLAVVHGIVKSHGGAVEVASKLNHGTTFKVLLPASAAQVQAIQPASAPVRGAGEHILYVDDEEPLVFLIARVLERLGYRVTGCIDPEQALDELKTRPQNYDLLVTDLSMRGMNGFELARKARELRPDLPVVLTSGYLRNEDRETAQQCGIREFILKPNTVEELGHAIDRSLRALQAQR